MPGSPSHLVARFFDVATAKPLNVEEAAFVLDRLGDTLAPVFFEQSVADQRHGYHASQVVIAHGLEQADVVEAALLHDIGKRHARLGLFGRVLASILIKIRFPLFRRVAAYRDHGAVAARELAELGAARLTVEFAMHHHGTRPAGIPVETWRVLQIADQPPKPGR